MKTLPGGNEGPQWQSSLLNDLSFIKKHLRYPFNGRTLSTTIILGVGIGLVSRLALVMLIFKVPGHHHNTNHIETIVIPGVVLLILGITLYNYWQSLRFLTISTRFFAYENQQLIKKFLEAQHLLVFRHPDAPEVFQIVGRNRGVGSEEQEIMVFIADDKRILINSHHTNSGFRLTPPSKNYKIMADRLRQWLQMHDLHVDDERTAVRKSDVTL